MRWADMDLLGHVNNVKYLEYVAEAREQLLAGTGVERAPVTRHRVEFAAPLVFRRRPVLVDSWFTEVGGDRLALAHEVYDAPQSPDGERIVHLRVSTELDGTLPALAQDRAETLVAP